MAARILVAEDQTDIRDLLVMNLRSAGYEVSAVGDGEQALAQHAERAGDLLILDLMMPRVDGLELGDDYLTKPFSTPASASRRSTYRTSSTAFFRRARASPRPPARAARASVWRSSSALLNSMLAPSR